MGQFCVPPHFTPNSCKLKLCTCAGKFWTNPQYRVTLEGSVASSMVISLIKVTGKLKQQTNDIAIGFAIFKVGEREYYLPLH